MDVKTILSYVTPALSVAATIAHALAASGMPFAGAVETGVKIAEGVAAGVPEAVALNDQFQSGTIPAQSELDAYVAAEDGAYAKLMASIDAGIAAAAD